MFRGLGFRLVGRHKSKEVDLYKQGEIHFVLNREKEGFAHSFQLLHGPSVCALTLTVDNVDRAMDRARAMLCQSHMGRIGPGEALIPAVGGIEGSLIYFLDASGPDWRDDFAPVD